MVPWCLNLRNIVCTDECGSRVSGIMVLMGAMTSLSKHFMASDVIMSSLSNILSSLFLQDNLSVFLRGCEELGLKGSQLFDPGDLQDISTRPNAK